MESNLPKEPFSPEKLYEEEFDIVRSGEGPMVPQKLSHPHAAYWNFAVVILCSTLAFTLGRLSFLDSNKPAIRIEQGASVVNAGTDVGANKVSAPVPPSPISAQTASASRNAPIPGGFVASKNGTKYYIPTCGGASRIKEENKIWFTTKAEAEKAGYGPAANCPGL